MIAAKSLSFSLTTGSLGPWRAPPAAPGKGKLWVGTSGYIYPHWKSVVYPDRLPQKHWFDYYARLFDTVEINNTFYRLPEGKVFAGWREQAPEGFRFAVKFSRYGTHMKKLKDPEGPLGMFFEKAAHLGPDGALGPVLVQLPPSFGLQLARLEAFLQQLRAVAPTAQKVALEVRDARWLTDDVYALLRRFHVALCIHDHKDIKCPHPQVVTADWSYLRFHGHDYSQCYADEALREHARWIRGRLEAGGDVYAYFNNDQHAHAVRNALSLREIILDA